MKIDNECVRDILFFIEKKLYILFGCIYHPLIPGGFKIASLRK